MYNYKKVVSSVSDRYTPIDFQMSVFHFRLDGSRFT